MLNYIKEIEKEIENPNFGLPEDLFLFISRLTPMVNVDLLIKNDSNETLLTWREDAFYEPGWHIPGGIIRYKETFKNRINEVAKNELGTKVKFWEEPINIEEVTIEGKTRGHFISLLYQCTLIEKLDESLKYIDGKPRNGQWKWHKNCPDNLMKVQEFYRKFI